MSKGKPSSQGDPETRTNSHTHAVTPEGCTRADWVQKADNPRDGRMEGTVTSEANGCSFSFHLYCTQKGVVCTVCRFYGLLLLRWIGDSEASASVACTSVLPGVRVHPEQVKLGLLELD